MTAPSWNNVRLLDQITASGQVVGIERCENGDRVFTIRDAKLLDHKRAPKSLYTASVYQLWVVSPGTVSA